MINTRDLRLGNLVEHEVFGVVEVVAIYKHAIDVSKDGKTKEWFAGSIEKPIPLTEEWLIRLGFEKINHIHNGVLYLHKLVKIAIYPNGMIELRGAAGFSRIEYVHQLQNLYFALTQTELTLSNP